MSTHDFGDVRPPGPDERAGRIDGEEPTTQDPLRGLQHLARVALIGRDNILTKAREPVAYVWQDIAVAGTIVLLAGGSSGGKTTLVFLILVARAILPDAVAVSVLGRKVTPAPADQFVVLIEGEHAEGSACRKLEKSCALLGVHDLALSRVILIARKAVRLGSPEWDDIVRLVAAGLVSDIAIDTVARVAPGDANEEREQVAIFDTVARAIEAAPPGKAPTAWAVAHTRKGGDGTSLDDVGGSIQRVGQADSVLMVKGTKSNGRTVSTTVTFAKLREDPDDYPMPVTYSIAKGEDGRPAIRYHDAPAADDADAVDASGTGASGTGASGATTEGKILDTVARAPGRYKSPTAIVTAAHVSKGPGLAAVKRLETAGKLDRGPCAKCRGKGRLPQYDHNDDGRCFACDGTGKAGGYVVASGAVPAVPEPPEPDRFPVLTVPAPGRGGTGTGTGGENVTAEDAIRAALAKGPATYAAVVHRVGKPAPHGLRGAWDDMRATGGVVNVGTSKAPAWTLASNAKDSNGKAEEGAQEATADVPPDDVAKVQAMRAQGMRNGAIVRALMAEGWTRERARKATAAQ